MYYHSFFYHAVQPVVRRSCSEMVEDYFEVSYRSGHDLRTGRLVSSSESREDRNRAKRVDTGRPKRRFDIPSRKGLRPSRYIGLRLLDSGYSSSI